MSVATDLFYRDGFRVTGVDAVVAAAGVAKRSLYRHFPSKDALIAAVLRRRHEHWLRSVTEGLARRAVTPAGKILAWFDMLEESIAQPDYRGCGFFNAAIEFPDAAPEVRAVIEENNLASHRLLTELAAQAGADAPDAVARQLGVLRRGAQITATVTRDPKAVRDARTTAETVLEKHGVSVGRPTVAHPRSKARLA